MTCPLTCAMFAALMVGIVLHLIAFLKCYIFARIVPKVYSLIEHFTCKILFTQLGTFFMNNGVCEEELNNEVCCFDGMDCRKDLAECSILVDGQDGESIVIYLDASLDTYLQSCMPFNLAISEFDDGYCDEYLNNEQCQFDGTDCAMTSVCHRKCYLSEDESTKIKSGSIALGIRNGICEEALMLEQCCFDGGDCPCPECSCPTCPKNLADKHSWLGDNMCDRQLNSRICCFDLGDCGCITNEDICEDFFDDIANCLTCPIPNLGRIADGVCDIEFLNEECCMDGNDCEGVRTRCPTCKVEKVGVFEISFVLGDGTCHPELDTPECCLDEGDCTMYDSLCPDCQEHVMQDHGIAEFRRMGDGICDLYGEYPSEECCYENGDCDFGGICITCDVSHIHSILNEACDLHVS